MNLYIYAIVIIISTRFFLYRPKTSVLGRMATWFAFFCSLTFYNLAPTGEFVLSFIASLFIGTFAGEAIFDMVIGHKSLEFPSYVFDAIKIRPYFILREILVVVIVMNVFAFLTF